MDINQISIKKIIIHKIDHIKSDKPLLADIESPLNPDVEWFLEEHIRENYLNSYIREANFVVNPTGKRVLKNLCKDILDHPGQFVAKSREIASHLFEVVEGDNRISPSDLAVCLLEDRSVSQYRLALFKLDAHDSFVDRQVRVKGKLMIELRKVVDVLPTGGVQKCAFVLPEDLKENRGYNLKVLDLQQPRGGGSPAVASFFSKDFLQCKVVLPPPAQQDIFVRANSEYIDKKKGEWDIEEIENFEKHVLEALESDELDIDSFAEETIQDDEEQNEYKEFIESKKHFPKMLNFASDSLIRGVPKLTFTGVNGLRVEINADAVGDGKTLSYSKDENLMIWNVKINTVTWRRKMVIRKTKASVEVPHVSDQVPVRLLQSDRHSGH